MIELKGIATYDSNFSYKNEANRNRENKGAEFNRLIGGTFKDMAGSQRVSEVQRKDNDENVIESKVGIITYDIFGKILKLELFSGLNVNAVI